MTLLLLNRLLTAALTRWPRAERVMVGQPVVLVDDGKLVRPHLKHEGISEDEVMEALR